MRAPCNPYFISALLVEIGQAQRFLDVGRAMDRANQPMESRLEQVRQEILPGEMVTWIGCEPHLKYRLKRLLRIGLLAVWFILAISFAALMLLMNPAFLQKSFRYMLPVLTPVAIALPGGYFLLRETFSPGKSGPDLYAITTRRALVISVGREKTVCSYDPEMVKSIQIKRRKDGSGDIIFENTVQWDMDAEGRPTRLRRKAGFFGLRSVDDINSKFQQIGGADQTVIDLHVG